MSNISKYQPVSAVPAKRFFVEMLTRDISLEDAILDLLDNCVDGIQRTNALKMEIDKEKPYLGHWAKITITPDIFIIEDNCGGIAWENFGAAIKMGKESDTGDNLETIGVYGIGMKRAIFKLGCNAEIWTHHLNDNFKATIPPEWIKAEHEWDVKVEEITIPLHQLPTERGTKITVKNLTAETSEHFSKQLFITDLVNTISTNYSRIINKGFEIRVNDILVESQFIQWRYEENEENSGLRPYIYRTTEDDVEISLIVGIRERQPTLDEQDEEQISSQMGSKFAGWTVICNDRVVLFCDRTELTGWGVSPIPKYHTQFIHISGVVEFRGDPKKLPTTTTKRGLNTSSILYMKILREMQHGLKLFTSFTYKWKSKEKEINDFISAKTTPISYAKLVNKVETMSIKLTAVGGGRSTRLAGKQYDPSLPIPQNEDENNVRVTFYRSKQQIEQLAMKLFNNQDINENERDQSNEVGKASFDYAYRVLVSEEKS